MDNYTIVFESKRIYFCSISERLIKDYLIMVNDPNVAKMIRKEYKVFTQKEEKEWVKEKIKNNDFIFSMIDKDSQKFIGNIELMHVTDNDAEVGICITSSMQDKHYGTEAMKEMVQYAYEVLKIKNIYLYVFDFNKRAIKCYENVGFKIDGPGKEGNDYHMTHKRC